MKKNGIVVNAKLVKLGRHMAKWAASGMNWGRGPYRDEVQAAGRMFIRTGAAELERLGRMFEAEEAAAIAEGELVNRNTAPTSRWFMCGASEIILGAVESRPVK